MVWKSGKDSRLWWSHCISPHMETVVQCWWTRMQEQQLIGSMQDHGLYLLYSLCCLNHQARSSWIKWNSWLEKSWMITYYIIHMYLDQCMDGTLALPAVLSGIVVFEDKAKSVQKMLGQLFEYGAAICHPAMLSPSSLPESLNSSKQLGQMSHSGTLGLQGSRCDSRSKYHDCCSPDGRNQGDFSWV